MLFEKQLLFLQIICHSLKLLFLITNCLPVINFHSINLSLFVCIFLFQFQIQLQSGLPQPDLDHSTMNHTEEDDIDAALKDLQESLEGSSVSSPGDITHIPELSDYVRFLK